MKQTLSTYEIVDALNKDRQNNGYSYEGCKALADYLEQLELELGEEIELDVVAIRCDYTEFKNYQDINEQYNLVEFDDDDELDDDEKDNLIKIELENKTSVIEFDTGIIIQDY